MTQQKFRVLLPPCNGQAQHHPPSARCRTTVIWIRARGKRRWQSEA